MNRRILAITLTLAATIALGLLLPAHADITIPKDSSLFNVKYEMNVLPTADDQGGAAGADWTVGTPGGETAGPPSVSGGIMSWNFTTSGPHYEYNNGDTGLVNFNTGWTIEFRAKAGTTIPSSTWAFSAIALPGLGHNDQIGFLHIAQGRTNFGDGGPVSFDVDRNDNTADFHVFRMAQEPGIDGMGAVYQVWRDGVLLSKLDGDGNPIPNSPLTTARGDLAGLGLRKIAFGDQGGAEWMGSSEIDYFRFDTTGAFAPLPLSPPGDVNGDLVVNIFDINLVSANWGTPGGPTGDANGDGNVDIFDINLISANWTLPPPGGAAAVPEPSTIWLLGLVGLTAIPLLSRGRRRQ